MTDFIKLFKSLIKPQQSKSNAEYTTNFSVWKRRVWSIHWTPFQCLYWIYKTDGPRQMYAL